MFDSITVNGKPATFSRNGQELTITPATTLRKAVSTVRIRLMYMAQW